MTEDLTLGQAARRYNVSRSTLHRLVTAGKIPGAVFDDGTDTWRIPTDAMDAEYEPRIENADQQADLRLQVAELRMLLEVREEQVEDLRGQVADLRANIADLRALPAGDRQAAVGGADDTNTVTSQNADPRPRRGGRIGRFLGFD